MEQIRAVNDKSNASREISALLFLVEEQQYALDTESVRMIVPAVELRSLPGAPEYVAGLMNFRGTMVPVLDITCLLKGKSAKDYYSTRIALVDLNGLDGQAHLVGLLLEGATISIVDVHGTWLTPGIALPETPFLGDVTVHQERMVQLVKPDNLLSADVQDRLFSA